jgi:hypothetical protein
MNKIFFFGAALFLFQSSSWCGTAQKAVDTVKTIAPKDTIASPGTAVAKSGFARLRVVSQPDSATIVFDSLEKGHTPMTLDSLPSGQHVVLIKKNGYFLKKISITLAPDSLQEISAVLVKPGCIVVKSNPPGATVFIDNKESGVTPYENQKIKPGSYSLRLELKQHEIIERPIIINEAKCDTIPIAMPFSKAYIDSVAAFQMVVADKNRKFKKTVNLIVLGVFSVFLIVIIGIEAGNAS